MSQPNTLPTEIQAKTWMMEICDAEDAGAVLRRIIEEHHCQLTEDSPEGSMDRLEASEKYALASYMLAKIQRLEILNPTVDEFYAALARCLSNDALLPTLDDKAAALTLVVSYPSLPYEQCELLPLGDDACRKRREELQDAADMLWRLSRRRYARDVDFCAAYLDAIEEFDRTDRALLLSELLD